MKAEIKSTNEKSYEGAKKQCVLEFPKLSKNKMKVEMQKVHETIFGVVFGPYTKWEKRFCLFFCDSV